MAAGDPAAGKEAACVTAAGDYAFTGGWKERGRIWVNRLSDGAEVGVFDPGPTVGGVDNTGWIDLLTGLNAFSSWLSVIGNNLANLNTVGLRAAPLPSRILSASP